VGFSVLHNQVLFNPCYQMVLEHALDELMEDVGCDQFMDISMWKSMCKGLKEYYDFHVMEHWQW
jgi:hypothetical protein